MENKGLPLELKCKSSALMITVISGGLGKVKNEVWERLRIETNTPGYGSQQVSKTSGQRSIRWGCAKKSQA